VAVSRSAVYKGCVSDRRMAPMSNVTTSLRSSPSAAAQSRVACVELNSGGAPPPDSYKGMGGSDWPEFNLAVLKSTLATIAGNDPDGMSHRIAVTKDALSAFKPTDEIEGMIAAQAVTMHQASMDCFRRAVIPGQPAEAASSAWSSMRAARRSSAMWGRPGAPPGGRG
jgi:hypothetical protein